MKPNKKQIKDTVKFLKMFMTLSRKQQIEVINELGKNLKGSDL